MLVIIMQVPTIDECKFKGHELCEEAREPGDVACMHVLHSATKLVVTKS